MRLGYVDGLRLPVCCALLEFEVVYVRKEALAILRSVSLFTLPVQLKLLCYYDEEFGLTWLHFSLHTKT